MKEAQWAVEAYLWKEYQNVPAPADSPGAGNTESKDFFFFFC